MHALHTRSAKTSRGQPGRQPAQPRFFLLTQLRATATEFPTTLMRDTFQQPTTQTHMQQRALLLFAVGLVGIAATQTARATENLAVRGEFQRAYATAESGAASGNDSEMLRAYVLYPYLQQLRLQRATTNESSENTDRAIEEFLTTHGTAPVARELRRTWYASLAKRRQWERYLANYREVDDPALRCHALTARLALQRLEGLQAAALAMWIGAADSLPACEPPFTWLKEQEALTPEVIEWRARLALRSSNPAFARQLIAMLSREKVAPLTAWAELIERPRSAIDVAIAQPGKAIEPNALLDGWSRLTRADLGGALLRFPKLVSARNFDEEAASRYALELGLALSWSRRPEALQYFARVHAAHIDERAAEWHARAAIWASDWKVAIKVIAAMPATLAKQTRWRYWSARSAEQQGKSGEARKQYGALLTDDNYYAALAAARLGVPYTPQQQPLLIDDAQVLSMAQQAPFVRARELRNLESLVLRASAYEEWRYGYNQLSPEARKQAIVLATRWGWYDQAVTTAAQLGVFNDYVLFYPRPFDKEVENAAKLANVPPAFIYATLRQESLYRVDAFSIAGAKGVMQLLPDTAQSVARRWRMDASGNLFDPAINIPIGAAKLRDMIDRFGQPALALAAYNAGPNAVPRWLPAATKESDVWIENIPYNETRTYVQRIFWHSLVFEWLATKSPPNTKHWLTQVGPLAPKK